MAVARVGVIIPAAGAGQRLAAAVPKALLQLGGVPLLVWAARAAVQAGAAALVVAAPPGRRAEVEALLTDDDEVRCALSADVVLSVVEGGGTRQRSVEVALAALAPEIDVVLVHDAARALAPAALVRRVVAAVESGMDAVVPAVPVVDTLKQVDSAGAVVATPDRSSLRAVQTPQGFRRKVLEDAHRAAVERGDSSVTDDAGLVERNGGTVHVVPGDDVAFKITTAADVLFAEALLAPREESS